MKNTDRDNLNYNRRKYSDSGQRRVSSNNRRINERMQKRAKRKRILNGILVFCVVALVTLGIVFGVGVAYYTNHFLKGTVINGIDVSGMTLQELDETISNYYLIVRQRGKEGNEIYVEKITGGEIGIEILSDSGIEEIMKNQNKLKWFLNAGEIYEKDKLITYDKKKLDIRINNLKGLSEKHAVKPTDAAISEYNTHDGYSIVEETQGNFLDVDNASKVLEGAISDLKLEVDLDKEGCYLTPSVNAGDKKLNNLLNRMNELVDVTITYNFDGIFETVDGRNISEWIVVNDYEASLDYNLVEAYIATLRRKYDTIFRSRVFETSYGKSINIKKGDYGWWMNYVKETQELMAQIEEGKSGERTPVYYQTAAQYGAKDYGDTYVEINLTAQHLFLYVDGECILESDFVSGNTSNKWGTPPGVYGITYKERYGKLVGETYESTVSYWMPFNGDIGLHDAVWKTQFGSDFYKTDGSHGCINLPYLVAKAIYENVSKGTPVICYKLKGTESDSVTVQSYEEIAQAAIEAIDAIGDEITQESAKGLEAARHLYDKIHSKAKAYVTNYEVLTAAEAKYKELVKETETQN